MWDVIWEMRFKFFSCKNFWWRFILVISLDHFIVSFWLSSLDSANDACSFSTHRVTYACFRCIERCVLVLDLSSDVYVFDETTQAIAFHQTESDSSPESDSETTQIAASHQTASDSSNMTRATHQAWWERLVSIDETKPHHTCEKNRKISSNLTNMFLFFW
jgi:hypothetical protein